MNQMPSPDECVVMAFGEHVRLMHELSRLRDALDEINLDPDVPSHIHDLCDDALHPPMTFIYRQ